MSQKVSPATLVQIKGVQELLLGSLRNLGAVKVNALGCGGALQTLQLALISAPLVRDTLATLKATNRDNHDARLLNLEEVEHGNFRPPPSKRGWPL